MGGKFGFIPETATVPSVESLKQVISPRWPISVWISLPVGASQTMSCLSREPETTTKCFPPLWTEQDDAGELLPLPPPLLPPNSMNGMLISWVAYDTATAVTWSLWPAITYSNRKITEQTRFIPVPDIFVFDMLFIAVLEVARSVPSAIYPAVNVVF